MVVWLVGWLVGWMAGWLVGWLSGSFCLCKPEDISQQLLVSAACPRVCSNSLAGIPPSKQPAKQPTKQPANQKPTKLGPKIHLKSTKLGPKSTKIGVPQHLADYRKTVVIKYKDKDGWVFIEERKPAWYITDLEPRTVEWGIIFFSHLVGGGTEEPNTGTLWRLTPL